MTFFELIRSSLTADSAENKPPGNLVKVMLYILQAKAVRNRHGEGQPIGSTQRMSESRIPQ